MPYIFSLLQTGSCIARVSISLMVSELIVYLRSLCMYSHNISQCTYEITALSDDKLFQPHYCHTPLFYGYNYVAGEYCLPTSDNKCSDKEDCMSSQQPEAMWPELSYSAKGVDSNTYSIDIMWTPPTSKSMRIII